MLLLGLFIAFSLTVTIDCQTCHLRELDLCAATLLVITQNPSGIATNEHELTKQCGFLKEADFCLKNFTKRCTTPLQRELINFVTEGSGRLLKEYCSAETSIRQSYLKHAPCLNRLIEQRRALAARNQKVCVKDLQLGLETITKVDWEKRIPAGCCLYRRFSKCIQDVVKSSCGKEAVDFMTLLIRMALSKLPDIICTGYGPENFECRKLLPRNFVNPKGPRSKSVLSRLFSAYTGL